MRKSFVILLLSLLAIAALFALSQYAGPGYVLIAIGDTTVEMTFWVGLAVALLLFAVLYFGFNTVRAVISQRGALGKWLAARRRRRSLNQTTQGLIAFIEGNWEKARRVLAQAAEKSETPLVNYLFAARSSDALGDSEQTDAFLRKAELSTAGADIAVGLTQAELQLKNGQLEQCLATLTRVKKVSDKHPEVLRLLKDVYVGLGDWTHLTELLPQLAHQKLISEAELAQLERRAYAALLERSVKKSTRPLDDLQAAWKHFPNPIVKNSQLIADYVRLLLAHGGDYQAEHILRQALNKQWNNELIMLYGQLKGADPREQLLQAEAWLKSRPNNAALLLALGRLSLRNQLWGKAREYFQASLGLEPSADVYAELGRLLAHLGEHEKSTGYFRQGLLFSTHGLPALPMPDGAQQSS